MADDASEKEATPSSDAGASLGKRKAEEVDPGEETITKKAKKNTATAADDSDKKKTAETASDPRRPFKVELRSGLLRDDYFVYIENTKEWLRLEGDYTGYTNHPAGPAPPRCPECMMCSCCVVCNKRSCVCSTNCLLVGDTGVVESSDNDDNGW